MSSGSLPFATYHRANHLGSGSFGSVVTVYNDDGEEYALKLFLEDDDDNDDEDEEGQKPLGLGTLREISCLRLLRGQHPNIVNMVDVQSDWSDEEGGAGTSGCLGMALPLYRSGSIADSIDRKTFQAYPKKVKVELAHGVLSALVFLHDNGILHRDFKSDNILLEANDDGKNHSWRPILIDFSLAKPINNAIWCESLGPYDMSDDDDDDEAVAHTGEVGTVVFTAPEIVQGDTYGKPSDLYSVGVVLLELLQNQTFSALKHREAVAQIKESLDQLPTDAPFPNLIRSLLCHNPSKRPTARQALEHPLFTDKFSLAVPGVKRIHVDTALPYEENDTEENTSPNIVIVKKGGNSKQDPKIQKRIKIISSICNDLGSSNQWTKQAALEYSQLLEQLEDTIDNVDESQGLLDRVVLAHRFFELELLDLDDLSQQKKGRFASWSLQEYVDNEGTIFMMTDYCLYPRKMAAA